MEIFVAYCDKKVKTKALRNKILFLFEIIKTNAIKSQKIVEWTIQILKSCRFRKKNIYI